MVLLYMMATAAVLGLSAGKRLLPSSTFLCPSSSSSSDISEKLSYSNDHGGGSCCSAPAKPHLFNIQSKKSTSSSSSNYGYDPRGSGGGGGSFSKRPALSVEALRHNVPSSEQLEEESIDSEFSVEALLLLQKSMLEKQWSLTFDSSAATAAPPSWKARRAKIPVTCSGISARQRRISARRRRSHPNGGELSSVSKQLRAMISPQLLQNRLRGYVKGTAFEQPLTHAEVVGLSKKIRAGLFLEDHKFRLKGRLGCEPSDEQLAMSLRISRAELQSRVIECSLAREKLAMSNVRLVMSVAQRYDNMGTEMADLVQGGLIGLLRGIEKFDSSKGFKISTYVYWWIRQGVARALIENSKTLRLPSHLHERLTLIRTVKIKLQEKGITPSIDRIAEALNMSQKKVRNATEAVNRVFSLDREAFPSLNGLPGETLHSYIADTRIENNPWHGVDNWALKDEVNKLIDATLGVRERDIVRLYYGLDSESLTWEDISKRKGLSRERVRQVGLLAVEKLKHAARKRSMEAMLVKH